MDESKQPAKGKPIQVPETLEEMLAYADTWLPQTRATKQDSGRRTPRDKGKDSPSR